jgi:hypothetical protein
MNRSQMRTGVCQKLSNYGLGKEEQKIAGKLRNGLKAQ